MKNIHEQSLNNQAQVLDGNLPAHLAKSFKQSGYVVPKGKNKKVSAFKYGKAIRYDVPTKAAFVETILKGKHTPHNVSVRLGVTESTVRSWVNLYTPILPQALAAPIGTPYITKQEKILVGGPKSLRVGDIATEKSMLNELTA